jgi:UDP-2,4-diacetamido-2,4,6-trideoxy-beta-L-altropyranose hydrolase
MGLPTLLIDVAENQIPVARELDRLGIAIHLGRGKDVCENIAHKLRTILDARDFRAQMSRKGRALVDGRGSDRVVALMCKEALRLRLASRKDCRLLWEWVNDEGTRAASFSSKVISWEQHQSWFEDKMKDPGCLILIAENSESKPVGQIRLDLRSDSEREIAVSLAPDSRGVGLGSQLIDLGVCEAFARTDAQRVHAFIRPQNHASIRAFERAKFVKLGEDVVRSLPALHYYRLRNPKPM